MITLLERLPRILCLLRYLLQLCEHVSSAALILGRELQVSRKIVWQGLSLVLDRLFKLLKKYCAAIMQ